MRGLKYKRAIEYTVLFLTLFFGLSCPGVYGQEKYLTIDGETGVKVQLSYWNKAVYYPGDPVWLKIDIVNDSPQVYRFKVADQRVFNLNFRVTDLSNLQMENTKAYGSQKNKNVPAFFREVSLATGERFSIIENLVEYVDLGKPGAYRVYAQFFPELDVSAGAYFMLSQNLLDLSIHPDLSDRQVPAAFVYAKPELLPFEDESLMMYLKEESLAPDEVVDYIIRARQKREWDKFFSYMDLEKLLLQNSMEKRSYIQLSESDRRMRLAKFRETLKQEQDTSGILFFPTDFSIMKTEYTIDEAKVLVEELFDQRTYIEVKEFTYYLYRRDGVWFVYNYEVFNRGTR